MSNPIYSLRYISGRKSNRISMSVTHGDWWGCSSIGRASDRHVAEAGSISWCGEDFFSRTQLSVQTLLLVRTPLCAITCINICAQGKGPAVVHVGVWWILSSHLSLNREGRWGTTDDFATNFLHFSLFSTALLDLANSRPVHSPMLSSHLFLCLPCLLSPFTVLCKMDLTRPDERET